jgi:tryptophan synthase alpha chain
VVELGFPFSDPIADGPVIAASMHEALRGGATPARIFEAVRSVRGETRHALVAMASASIVERMGAERFIAGAASAGFDGLIVPDADPGGGSALGGLAAARGLAFVVLVAPTTAPARLPRLLEGAGGFVYLLARVGVTGERDAAPDIAPRVAALRRLTALPIAAGFGISRPEHVAAATASADAAIVGSAFVRRMGAARDPAAAAAELAAVLAAGLARRVPPPSVGSGSPGPGSGGMLRRPPGRHAGGGEDR